MKIGDLPFILLLSSEEVGDGGLVFTHSRMSSIVSFRDFLPRPPSQTMPDSGATATEVSPKGAYFTTVNFWVPSLSSSKQMAPRSVQRIASCSDTEAMEVKVWSPSGPKRQFRPDKAFGLLEEFI